MSVEVPPHGEVAGILDWLDEKPTLGRHVAAARRLDAAQNRAAEAPPSLRLLMVRNFTIEPIEPLLKVAAARAGFHVSVTYSDYDPLAGALGEQLAGAPDVVVVALRLEELTPQLASGFLALPAGAAAGLAEAAVEAVASTAARVRAACAAPILVHNLEMPLSPAAGLADSQQPQGHLNMVRALNVRLAEGLAGIDGAHILDIDHLFAQVGLRRCQDARGSRTSDAPYSQAALRALADAQVRHLRALSGPAARCVVLDCDNTLWGGVVGEVGASGVVLAASGPGRRYRDFQQALVDLRRGGTLLAICSKNEERDVLEVIRRHPDCLIHEDDLAAIRVNWDDKAENISAIAAELNLDLRHIVFVDDNPAECEWVQARLPEVHVVNWATREADGVTLRDLGLFDSLAVTSEDRARTERYRSEGSRRRAREDAPTLEEYLRALQMVATVGRPAPLHLSRLAQLTQRTNQFNLTTRRYDLASLGGLLADPDSAAVWLELTDRFGDHGLVGLGILRREEAVARIDTLLLSCRVIGRGAEAVLVNRLATLAGHMGARALVGAYVPTARNGQVADLYDRLGFQPATGSAPGSEWTWSLAHGVPGLPDWIEVVDRG